MKILQWNVCYRENPKNIAEEIQRLAVDVVCAQELIQDSRGTDTAREIAERIGYEYVYQEAATWDHQEKDTLGNAIFSRFPIVGNHFQYVQAPNHNPPNPTQEGRVYLEATVQTPAGLLEVGCVHLSYSPNFELTAQRKKEIDTLISIVSQKNKKFILCGDLNDTPGSYTIQQLSRYFQHAGPDFQENSWTTKPFQYDGLFEQELNRRLDYVFTTPDVQVIHSQMAKTPYSDHLPILVEIQI